MVKLRTARKPRTEDDALVAAVQQRLGDNMSAYLDALEDLALGHWTWEMTPEGERRVYREAPNYKALERLLAYKLGQPVQRKEEDSTHVLVGYQEAMEARRAEWREKTGLEGAKPVQKILVEPPGNGHGPKSDAEFASDVAWDPADVARDALLKRLNGG